MAWWRPAGAAGLGRVLVLGNSFAAYAGALTDAQTADARCALARATPFAAEGARRAAGDGGAFRNAFNSLLRSFAPHGCAARRHGVGHALPAGLPSSLPCALHPHIPRGRRRARAAVT